MSDTRRLPAAAVFVLLLATFTRFHLLEAQSFWNDEGNSARLSERSIPAIIEGTASDIHPPLYYLALRGWRELLGETEFGLRSLSAFAGVLVVAVVVAIGRRTTDHRRQTTDDDSQVTSALRGLLPVARGPSAAIAGLLAALSPVLVYYSQETRMYALLALLAALSAWVLLVWLGGVRRPLLWMIAYTLLLAAGLYTHYFFPAVVVAQGAVVVWREWGKGRGGERERGSGGVLLNSYLVSRVSYLGLWVGMAAVAALLYLSWVPVFLRQIGGRGEAAGLVEFARESARWLALGNTVGPNEATWAVVAYVALVVLGVAVGGRRSAVGLLLVLIPLALMFLVGATDPAFFKFLLAVAPFLAVLAGLAWNYELRLPSSYELTDYEFGRASVRPWSVVRSLSSLVVPALTVAVLAGSLLSLGNLYFDPAYVRADYRGMAARIAADAHPNAGIILVAPNQWEVFTYYHQRGTPVYPLPRGRPDPALVEPELARIAAAHDRLYVLYWGDAQRDPNHVIERWLDAHAFKASEEWVGDVRFVVYALPDEAPAMTPSGATFAGLDGETITLHEFAVWPRVVRPGDVIRAQLAWSTDAMPERAYKVFLHLLDGAGNVVAQHDGEPAGGSRPTTGWAAGERVSDNHGVLLPPGLPPGSYTLRLGLYDALDPGARLVVGGRDGLELGRVTIP